LLSSRRSIPISSKNARPKQSAVFEEGWTHATLLISGPEYAHGVPGVLKNALDLVVGSSEFVGKPAISKESIEALDVQLKRFDTPGGPVKLASSTWNGFLPSTIVGQHFERYGIVGQSRAIADLIGKIELVSASRSTVLITGETGTGKELVARAVHNRSGQRNMPFIKVNCAAIPEALMESELFGYVRGAFTGAAGSKKGKFALANGGSILLDEIGTMSAALQAKLLRVLQEREIEPLGAERTECVDVRVIAATNRDLRQLMEEGRFQEDLYYRLHVIPIVVPPLRDRAEDIPMLVEYFCHKHATRNGKSIEAVEDGVLSWLQGYRWPGNVRELENAIERAVILTTGSTISRDAVTFEATVGANLQAASIPSLKLQQNVEWMERETIRLALAMSTAKGQAAKLMGISPRALSYYLAKYAFGDPNRVRQRPDSELFGRWHL
jgi:transcriptional regulator with GAF, ATPase, and Fis domain